MDNTSRDAKAAKDAGMSYGQWKVLHPETAPKKIEKKPKYQRVCPECGAEFSTDRADKRYCGAECATTHNRREFDRKRRAQLRAMSKV